MALNTTAKKRAFLAAYAETCSIIRAAKAAEVDRGTHYEWLRKDPGYAVRFHIAKEQAADALEDEAIRRAHEGMDKPVTVAGEKTIIREYSDTLLIFMLKGMRPQKFRDNVEVTGAGGGPITAAIEVVFRD